MRRLYDQYFTPASATQALLRHVKLSGNVFECCVGDRGIYNELTGWDVLWSNDIDPDLEADYHKDITQPWEFGFDKCDWVVSNPPFSVAPTVVRMAYDYSRIGVAMLLRLSFLEPCESDKTPKQRASRRGKWLAAHPPTKLIVLPRISFTGNGKTDNVTCAWMVWDKTADKQEIIIVPKGSNA